MKIVNEINKLLKERIANFQDVSKGKIKWFDSSRWAGAIKGDDGKDYEISLFPGREADKEYAKKLKKIGKGSVKFKITDDELSKLAVIGPWSFNK